MDSTLDFASDGDIDRIASDKAFQSLVKTIQRMSKVYKPGKRTANQSDEYLKLQDKALGQFKAIPDDLKQHARRMLDGQGVEIKQDRVLFTNRQKMEDLQSGEGVFGKGIGSFFKDMNKAIDYNQMLESANNALDSAGISHIDITDEFDNFGAVIDELDKSDLSEEQLDKMTRGTQDQKVLAYAIKAAKAGQADQIDSGMREKIKASMIKLGAQSTVGINYEAMDNANMGELGADQLKNMYETTENVKQTATILNELASKLGVQTK